MKIVAMPAVLLVSLVLAAFYLAPTHFWWHPWKKRSKSS
jgi:hypothetical protein